MSELLLLRNNKEKQIIFSQFGKEMTDQCVIYNKSDAWCAVSVDAEGYMLTWGYCHPGCTKEDNDLVGNLYDGYHSYDDVPDYDVVW